MSAQIAPQTLREAVAPPERRGLARDAVAMLVTLRDRHVHEHAQFFDLPRYVRPGDLFVVNDSATVAAALRAVRANGEALALHVSTIIDAGLWMVEPRGEVSAGEDLELAAGGRATILAPVGQTTARLWYARFNLPLPMHAFMAKVGEPIRYKYVERRFPLSDYQTIFARKPGSSEMPSAARPFTEALVRRVRRAGARLAPITLHCGVSSFEAPERPPIERFAVPPQTAALANAARRNGNRVIAVGTTVVRAMESAMSEGEIIASSGWTDLIVEPEHRLRAVDALITGFHEPSATHVAMLRAFLTDDLLTQAYDEAAGAGYFIHEFGDIHAIF
jgi:S-adenosylmethionine:tRNA ribosyltransferase-isomerase